jgi:hypothetical protein
MECSVSKLGESIGAVSTCWCCFLDISPAMSLSEPLFFPDSDDFPDKFFNLVNMFKALIPHIDIKRSNMGAIVHQGYHSI